MNKKLVLRLLVIVAMCACVALWVMRSRSGDKLVQQLEPLWKATCACETAECADDGARKLAGLIREHGSSTGSAEVARKARALTESIVECAVDRGASDGALDELTRASTEL